MDADIVAFFEQRALWLPRLYVDGDGHYDPGIVLDDDAFERIVTRLEAKAAPTAALRELMRDEDG